MVVLDMTMSTIIISRTLEMEMEIEMVALDMVVENGEESHERLFSNLFVEKSMPARTGK